MDEETTEKWDELSFRNIVLMAACGLKRRTHHPRLFRDLVPRLAVQLWSKIKQAGSQN